LKREEQKGDSSTASAKKSNDAAIQIADTPAPENFEGERKTVTMLFADIKDRWT
jgi:hypothetical protein